MILLKIEERLEELGDGWVKKWIAGDVTILEDIIYPYENLTKLLAKDKTIKKEILKSLETISVQELQSCGVRAKPEYHKIWSCEEAANRLGTELDDIKNYISKL